MNLNFMSWGKNRIDNIIKSKEGKKTSNKNILPNYVLNRHIKIITNGNVVFDSNDYKDKQIPESIQYSIKQYGYPNSIKPNNKTPLIYNINSNISSIFPSKEEQEYCMKGIN